MEKFLEKISGRVWVIVDSNGKPIDDIDTDMIYHNRHLAVTDISEMGQYAFGNLDGWRDFPQKAENGDILIVGKNFGAGSSRQHAVDCFITLGIIAIVGESFGAIYYRNAVNAGLPIFVAPGIASADIESGNKIAIYSKTGKITNLTTGLELPSAAPMSRVQKQIIEAGGLLQLAKTDF